MSTMEVYNLENAPEESKKYMEQAKEKFGFVPNVLGVMAESPAVIGGYMTLSGIFASSSLSAAECQIILLSASVENGCTYCVAAHSGGAAAVGVEASVITALRSDAPVEDARLEALRRFTQKIVTSHGWPEDDDLQDFLDTGFSKAQALEVLLGITVKTLSNYVNHLAHTPLDDALKPMAWEGRSES